MKGLEPQSYGGLQRCTIRAASPREIASERQYQTCARFFARMSVVNSDANLYVSSPRRPGGYAAERRIQGMPDRLERHRQRSAANGAYPLIRGLIPVFTTKAEIYARLFGRMSGPGIVQGPLARITWYHNIALLEKVSAKDDRLWYARQAGEHGWSQPILVLQIESRAHQRHGKAVSNFKSTLPPMESDMAVHVFKDPYLFDFLGTADPRREREVEQALVDHVQRFLLELGTGFAFVGRQVLLEVGDRDFYADLLFYHLKLRRYVVIELKAAEWETAIVEELPTDLQASLPTVEEIEAELGSMQDK